jgi:hypothetical protein
MKSQKILIVVLFLISFNAIGQNARFSQIWSAPVQFNPALTGRFDGRVRASSLLSFQNAIAQDSFYRKKTVYMNHQNVSVDIKLGKYRSSGDESPENETIDENDSEEGKDKSGNKKKLTGYWGAGFNYYAYGHETSPIKATFYSLSVARHFYSKSNRIFGFGLQLTNANGVLDESKGKAFNKEITGGAFRYPYINSNTAIVDRAGSQSYTDVNVGAYYGRVTETVMFELGAAMHHLFYPNYDASDVEDKDEPSLRHRVTAHSILRLRFNDKWGMVQKNMFWKEGLYLRSRNTDDNLEITAFWTGLELYRTDPTGKINPNFGFYTRNFQTMMPYLNLNFGRFVNVRYSYELPINSIKFPAYSAKRNEVSLIITAGRQTAPGTRFYKKLNFW